MTYQCEKCGDERVEDCTLPIKCPCGGEWLPKGETNRERS